MKTKILTLFLLFLPILLGAQNYEQQGDELFAQAQYEKAAKKYAAAIEVSGASSSLQSKKEKCAQCAKLYKQAISAEESSNYATASKSYADLYAIHALPNYKSKVDALKQKAIGIEAEKKVRQTLIIPEGTTKITKEAYKGRKDITTVIIPNSVLEIDTHAFDGCTNLVSVYLGSGIKKIRNCAFFCCKIKSLYISDLSAFCAIDFDPFAGFGEGTDVYLNDALLTNIRIPDNIKIIKNHTFLGCKSLTSVTIPSGVTSIGESAFMGCSSLKSVTIPNSVTSIGYEAFDGCRSLTSVTIPNSVTSIGRSAFRNCSSMTSVTIPNSVTSIGESAFMGCSSLKSVTISNRVTTIKNHTFSDCTSLTSVTIPNSVTRIENFAFFDCTSLTSVTISGSTTFLEEKIFSGCSNLKNINVDKSNPKFFSMDGILYYKSNDKRLRLHSFPCGRKGVYRIPDGTESVLTGAFMHCVGLTEVICPNSVTYIGNGAFYGCKNLTSITIPQNVKTVCYDAFDGCKKLNIKLPERFRNEVELKDCKSITYY